MILYYATAAVLYASLWGFVTYELINTTKNAYKYKREYNDNKWVKKNVYILWPLHVVLMVATAAYLFRPL